MKKSVLTASAVVCTLSVLSMICLGQIKKNRSVSNSGIDQCGGIDR